jgi:hypothetical protein
VDLGEDAYRVIATALTEGQGEFSEEDFQVACMEITESMIKGQFATLALEGKLSISVENGELKYRTSAHGRADLESQLAEQGKSVEQFTEEMRRRRK